MLTISGLACPHLHQQGWFLEPFRTVLGPLTLFLIILIKDWGLTFFPLSFLKSAFPETWIIVPLAVVGYLPFLLEHPRWWPQCLACKQHWVNVQFPCPVQLPLSTPLFLIPCSKSSYLLWLCLFCSDITGKVRAFSFGIHSWNPDFNKVLISRGLPLTVWFSFENKPHAHAR